MTAIVKPVASATSNVPASACGPRDMIVPQTMNTSANVPTSSTNVRRHRSAEGREWTEEVGAGARHWRSGRLHRLADGSQAAIAQIRESE